MGLAEVEAEDGAEVDAGGLEYENEDDEWAGEEVGAEECADERPWEEVDELE